jgi:hypothetical protein
MAAWLTSFGGFTPGDIRMLVDARATTEAIVDHLLWLVQDVNPGDRVMFHYSGHGAQFAGRNAAGEVDGIDDVICPVDFDWSEERMIADYQFVQIFGQMPTGVRFNWLSDSCHSGHLAREIPRHRETAKTFPAPVDMQWRLLTAAHKGMRTRGVVGGLLEVGFVAGCRSDQTSSDTIIDGQPQGALTGYFLRQLRATPHASLDALVAATGHSLADDGYSQEPVADGSRANMAFLG